MNATATATDLTGYYYPTAPGARTWREARPLYINGKRVSAHIADDLHTTVFIGGEIVFEGALPAEITNSGLAAIWARDTALNAAAAEAAAVDAAETIVAEAAGTIAAELSAVAVTADEHRAAAAAFGMAEFAGLFDLNGNLVPAVRVDGRYGWYWKLLDARGRTAGLFNESKAKNADRRRAANARKGYYVGRVRVPARAILAGGGIGTVMPVAERLDGGYSADAVIVDNGQ